MGQESVWEYPRPPRIEKFVGHVRVTFAGEVIADSNQAHRILETSHPPVYYIPVSDVTMGYLTKTEPSSFCEWKGAAHYYHLKVGAVVSPQVGWGYESPNMAFSAIKDHMAFYAHKVEACYVNDEKVQAQEGDFYGGWITSNIVGPFKGEEGSFGW